MIVYVVFVMISLLFGLLIKKKHYTFYYLIIAFGLAVLAFSMRVHPESDLVNHYNRINRFRLNQVSIQDVMKNLNVGTYLFFWLFSFLPDNAYLQAVSVLICYLLMFGLSYNVCIDNDAPKFVYLLCSMVILTSYNFYVMANSIRMWLVFSVFFYLLYNEIVRKKDRPLIWFCYIMLVLYHYGALILIAGRIIALVYSNVKKVSILKTLLLIACGIAAVIFLNSPYFNTYVMDKIEGYSTYATRGTWQTIIGFVRISMVYVLICRSFKKVEYVYKEFYVVVLFVCAVPILMYSNYTLILRFGDAVIAAASVPIVLSNKVSGYLSHPLGKVSVRNLMVLLCMVMSFAAFVLFDYRYLIFNF